MNVPDHGSQVIDAIELMRKHISHNSLKSLAQDLRRSTVITGVGKSWHAAQRCAATARSLGLDVHAVHATEVMHGDFGMVENRNLVAISHSGGTAEVIDIIAMHYGRCYLVTGNDDSPLERLVDHVLYYGPVVDRHSAPMESVIVAQIVLDTAIIMACDGDSQALDRTHPGGMIGLHRRMTR